MKWMPIFLAILALCSNVFGADCSLLSHQELGQEIWDEINRAPYSCLKNNVHLTFDDGPSLAVTPGILKELKDRGIKASFFVTTTNLDPGNSHYKEMRNLVSQTMDQGHLIADHGHEHNAYDLRMDKNLKVLEPGFTQEKREEQIKKSVDYLDWSTQGRFSKQVPLLFRFPYGRGAMPSENELKHLMASGQIHLEGQTYGEQLKEYRKISAPLQTVAGFKFSHLGWNHDSQDSSHGVETPETSVLKEYIKKNIKNLCGSPQGSKVALFHDIKKMNLIAIPIIADIGRCLGLKFVGAKEMVADEQLSKSGVLIKNSEILAGPVQNVVNGMNAVGQIGQNVCSSPIATDKSCWSEQYKKSYPHCSGGDSVCFEGKWYARTDPIVQTNCSLKD
jgi:peptidoglycan/xylan/chitin deacetylase (PgdA/CDA1 family)